MITRIVVADVSGHGSSVAEFSLSLRALLRKNINQKDQKRLVGQLNRQFTEMAGMRRFATALVITYLASRDRLSICNAGHPRPLFYRARDGQWSFSRRARGDQGRMSNLPLGVDDETSYQSFDLKLDPGDLVVFYTDALTEAADHSRKLLGEAGLVDAARALDVENASPEAIGASLLEAVARHRAVGSAEDDVTLVVLRHNASASPRLSLTQKVDVYAKVSACGRCNLSARRASAADARETSSSGFRSISLYRLRSAFVEHRRSFQSPARLLGAVYHGSRGPRLARTRPAGNRRVGVRSGIGNPETRASSARCNSRTVGQS